MIADMNRYLKTEWKHDRRFGRTKSCSNCQNFNTETEYLMFFS